MQKLTAQGVTNEIAAVLEGGHNWATADEHMRQTLPLHWTALNPATAYPLRVDSITRDQSGKIVVTGAGIPLQEYTVATTPTLTNAFTSTATASADPDGKLVYEDQNEAGAPRGFYRFVQP